MGPAGNILINFPISTFQQGLSHSALLLRRLILSLRFCSNQAFNRTIILPLLGCSGVLKNCEKCQNMPLRPLFMYTKDNLQFRQKWARNCKICVFFIFTQLLSLGDGFAAVLYRIQVFFRILGHPRVKCAHCALLRTALGGWNKLTDADADRHQPLVLVAPLANIIIVSSSLS